jgi:hypothetical protein
MGSLKLVNERDKRISINWLAKEACRTVVQKERLSVLAGLPGDDDYR